MDQKLKLLFKRGPFGIPLHRRDHEVLNLMHLQMPAQVIGTAQGPSGRIWVIKEFKLIRAK
jgi:hypothetical protein